MTSTKKAEEYFAGVSLTGFMKPFNLSLPPDTPVEFTDPDETERQASTPVKWPSLGSSTETSAHPLLVVGAFGTLETRPAMPHYLPQAHAGLLDWRIFHPTKVARVQEFRREVRMRPVGTPVDLSWFIEAHQSNEGVPSATLVSIINGFHLLIKNRHFQIIDMILRTSRLDRLAPETILAFARTLFPVRTKLSAWYPYLHRARNELRRRSLNAGSLMSGLA
jgi:hypothetical protein